MRAILLLLLTATTIFTQAQQINGLAKDDNGTALGGATISLIKATDSSVIKLAVTSQMEPMAFPVSGKVTIKCWQAM